MMFFALEFKAVTLSVVWQDIYHQTCWSI